MPVDFCVFPSCVSSFCVFLIIFFQFQVTGIVIIESLNRINDWLSNQSKGEREKEPNICKHRNKRIANQLFKQVVFYRVLLASKDRTALHHHMNKNTCRKSRIQFTFRYTQHVNGVNGKLKSVYLIYFQCCALGLVNKLHLNLVHRLAILRRFIAQRVQTLMMMMKISR